MKIKFTTENPHLEYDESWEDEDIVRFNYTVEVTNLEFSE